MKIIIVCSIISFLNMLNETDFDKEIVAAVYSSLQVGEYID